MATEDFYEECSDASKIKQFIIANYFTTWASIILNHLKRIGSESHMAYIDLFSGPGIYEDGSESTPILITKKILANPEFSNRIQLLFNDMNSEYAETLKRHLSSLPNISNLKYPPDIQNEEINAEVAEILNDCKLVPSLIFIDPWGYKGFSLQLIASGVKDFGCDCVSFFNYSRINMQLDNDKIPKSNFDEIFNCDAAQLAIMLKGKTPRQREKIILDTLQTGASSRGIKFVLPFRFDSEVNRTSHFIIFFTNHYTGYKVMKQIMYKASIKDPDGIALFRFDYQDHESHQISLFPDPENSIEGLKESILKIYQRCVIRGDELFGEHNVGTNYVEQNYKTALRQLYDEGIITTDRKPRKGSFPLNITITFP